MITNPEQKKVVKILAIIITVSFITLLLGIALSVYSIFIYPKNKGVTNATIIKMYSEKKIVTYSVDGKEYEKIFRSRSSFDTIGKKIKIYYNKQNPYKSVIASNRYLTLIVPAASILLLGVSGIICIVYYTKYIKV